MIKYMLRHPNGQLYVTLFNSEGDAKRSLTHACNSQEPNGNKRLFLKNCGWIVVKVNVNIEIIKDLV